MGYRHVSHAYSDSDSCEGEMPECVGRVMPCPHCRRKVRLSQKTARQRRQSPNSATVALFKSNQIALLAKAPLIRSTGAPSIQGYNCQIWNKTMPINKKFF